MIENTYIPVCASKKALEIPVSHPSLIMQDYQTDTTHHLSCGCNSGACIEERAWWFKKTTVSSASTSSIPAKAYVRPSLKPKMSMSSLNSESTY